MIDQKKGNSHSTRNHCANNKAYVKQHRNLCGAERVLYFPFRDLHIQKCSGEYLLEYGRDINRNLHSHGLGCELYTATI